MSEHIVNIAWERRSDSFAYPDYNREHSWQVPGGSPIAASAAQAYLGKPGFLDPEEALVAAISSCHMLTFLAICARKRLIVDAYEDDARGFMEKNDQGRLAITRVELSPRIRFHDQTPHEDQLAKMHHMSHEQCFIANSVRTDIQVLRMC